MTATDLTGGHHDHDEVDRFLDRDQAAVGRHAGHGVGLRVDRIQPPGEASGADRLEDVVAQPRLGAADADHGDALRVQQRAQGPCLGKPLAAVRGVDGGRRDLGPKLDRHLAVLGSAGGREARRPEHAQHAVVVRKDLCLEARDTVFAAQCREVLQEQAAEPTTSILVGDQEGDLRALFRQQLGGCQGRDPATEYGDQRDRLVVGLVEEPRHVGPSGGGTRREESQTERVLRDALVQRQQLLPVAGLE